MSLIHIVLFQFKADASPETTQKACADMLGLKERCIHPDSQRPYIKSLTGGKDNSSEGLQKNGIQYAFVVEFATTEDRDYYVATDPTHQAFVKSIGPIVAKVIVVDYNVGQF
ncbi:Stress responsive A/B barrel domain-containing protein [Mycena sanguinolenta]|uniref:Stress responsive A/B barrel domain-containing protein n=1 Tax=Mycena sanguinolenta TaxID=230812 RepID=A0A8H6ZDV4_9AGAR|nr:Stress responsive A/B barrel domain-containing protein [Mycena sanguinolenta]